MKSRIQSGVITWFWIKDSYYKNLHTLWIEGIYKTQILKLSKEIKTGKWKIKIKNRNPVYLSQHYGVGIDSSSFEKVLEAAAHLVGLYLGENSKCQQ